MDASIVQRAKPRRKCNIEELMLSKVMDSESVVQPALYLSVGVCKATMRPVSASPVGCGY
jgi:hypothetical protein